MATLMQDTVHEQRAMSSRVEAIGRGLARYGLVVVVAFPAMKGNVAFLMKDVVLLAVSFYLPKQDLVRAALPAAQRRQRWEVGDPRAQAAEQVADRG